MSYVDRPTKRFLVETDFDKRKYRRTINLSEYFFE